jgi:hypothetical protein
MVSRASDCADLTTEDNRTPIVDGMRLYNYYDCKWGVVSNIHDGWFTFTHDDGTNATLNGVRVSTREM